MKKITAMLLTIVMVISLLTACGGTGSESAKNLADLVSAETPDLFLYVDGADVTDGNVKFEQIAAKFSEVEMDGVHYYATSIKNLCAYDLSSVQSFFGETSDGFVR